MDICLHLLQIQEISNTIDMKDNYIPRVIKYIKHIILPKFPEVIDFSVENKYNFPVIFLEFNFVLDGTDEELENEIEDSIHDMFRYLSIEKITYGLNFRTQ